MQQERQRKRNSERTATKEAMEMLKVQMSVAVSLRREALRWRQPWGMTLILGKAALDVGCENGRFVSANASAQLFACLPVCLPFSQSVCLSGSSRQIFPQHKQQQLHSVREKNKLFSWWIIELHLSSATYGMYFSYVITVLLLLGDWLGVVRHEG